MNRELLVSFYYCLCPRRCMSPLFDHVHNLATLSTCVLMRFSLIIYLHNLESINICVSEPAFVCLIKFDLYCLIMGSITGEFI